MDISPLKSDSITFGKYKESNLQTVLKDRQYCKWLLKQEWFEKNYEYLYNKVLEYKPLTYFLKPITTLYGDEAFVETYKYFNQYSTHELNLPYKLTEKEEKCYEFYLKMTEILKNKIYDRIEKGDENIYDIKAPCKWLLTFEKESGLTRRIFKDFINSYELPNIPYLVERIKHEGGIEYNGAKSFLIAKKRSEDQEKYWENILKEKYGEKLGIQYKFKKCIFDFIHIDMNTIFECKLGLKDFDLQQYIKYKIALEKYRIIYIIGYDAVIHMEKKHIYTTDTHKYNLYIGNIPLSKHASKFDIEIEKYDIMKVDDLSTLFE